MHAKPRITADKCNVGRATIDMLPEHSLLVIFDFCTDEADSINGWHTMVHVCRKWRNLIFLSPRRLNLKLQCTPKRHVKAMLDVWPPLPIVVQDFGLSIWGSHVNIITALKHNDRVCQIALAPIPGGRWGKVMAAMSQPFSALTHLRLKSDDLDETPPVVSNSFLGSSAPHLRFLWLERIPFPGLPKLLCSTTDLVDLRLWEIPHSGYISPEAMVTCLSALTRLEKLDMEFESPRSRPNRESRRPPPPTRSVLPALTRFWFRGASEYLEDLLTRIDAPLLQGLFIGFFHQPIFDTPQLAQFISRTPTLSLHEQPQMLCFSNWGGSIIFPRAGTPDKVLQLGILCRQSDRQLTSLAQVCASSFPPSLIPTVEHLSILEETISPPRWQDDIEHNQWLELLHPFTAVKNLYLSKQFAPRIAPSLQHLVGGRATETLPTLRNLFLEELNPSRLVGEAIGKFVVARQLSNNSIAISHWERGPEPEWNGD